MSNELSLQDLLDKANKQTKRFIKDLEDEENVERVETLDSVRNDIRATRQNTEIKKNQFIMELKSGLGEKVKQNPNQVKVIKKSLGERIKLFIRNIFTKF